MNDNIQKIQKLYKEEEQRQELRNERIKEEKVILIKLYEVFVSVSTMTKLSFIQDEVKNLIKYIKFIHFPIQMRLFKPLPYYQLLQFREEQDPEFWKEIVTILVDDKHNTKMSQNSYFIIIFQGELPHKLYFIAINNQE